ncbi:MAG TPA: alpha/beta fold hydrolase [Gaiellaceae bacterium]|nr:alpha/beta fold hydrolase [Gaiellaceae bacterium]
MLWLRTVLVLAVLAAALGTAASATAAGTVGTTFPAGFAVPTDSSLGTPVLGFGAAGPVHRTPVIVLHGNNDTPYATACNPYGDVHALAQYLVDNGYGPSEVWGLGYQGDQCDLIADPTLRSGAAHTTVANVPDLDAFVRSVLEYTHSKQVDIVGHSLGGTLARAWMKADHTQELVRRLVQIDAPNHGIIDCSPDPANYWQAPANGGFTPSSPVCQEYGSPRTPFLRWLNGHGHGTEVHGKTDVLAIRNADKSFVYFPLLDGLFPGVPAIDSYGVPTDFSHSAELRGATTVNLTDQGVYDPFLGTSHLGILNSPDTWAATLAFLTAEKVR